VKRGLALICLAASPLLAQQFDVASVKPFKPGSAPESARKITAAHGTVTLAQQTLRECIQWADDIQDAGRLDGPGWIDVEQFDITGKASSPDVPEDQLRVVLQALLADRFHLVVRRTTQDRAVYALTVAKTGLKMRKVEREPVRGMKMGMDNGAFVQELVSDVPRLVSLLPIYLDHPVVDRTGLTGVYEMKLRVELPEHAQPPQVGMPFQGFGYSPGVFTAVEQLGLKLVATKGPMEVLVIDRVERPAAN
jgi:uncharacterized protein (TIGR03435 family)